MNTSLRGGAQQLESSVTCHAGLLFPLFFSFCAGRQLGRQDRSDFQQVSRYNRRDNLRCMAVFVIMVAFSSSFFPFTSSRGDSRIDSRDDIS